MTITTLPYVLRRVYPDGTQELVSEHPDFASGWSTGQRMTHEDRDNAFSLYCNARRVAKFGHSRLMTRRVPEDIGDGLELMIL